MEMEHYFQGELLGGFLLFALQSICHLANNKGIVLVVFIATFIATHVLGLDRCSWFVLL